jgi:hypothetical protein
MNRHANLPWITGFLTLILAVDFAKMFSLFVPDGWIAWLSQIATKDLIATAWAPLSIFVGAWTAFYFNNRRSRQERMDKEVTDGNLALSVLAEFYNQQLQYQKNYIDPHRHAPDAWFKIPSGPPLDTIRVELNRNSLGFVLESNGGVWQKAVLEERRFYFVNALVDERNLLLVKGWSKLEGAGITHGTPIRVSELEQILGSILYQQLLQMGSALIDQIDQNVKSSIKALEQLRAELRRIHPERKFISVAAAPVAAPAATPSKVILKPRQRPTGKYLPHEKD